MTTKADILAANVNPLQTRLISSDIMSAKNSNSSYRKPITSLNAVIPNRSSPFFDSTNSQENNTYSSSYGTNSYHSSGSGNPKKSPPKSLVIDTNNESAKFNAQNNHIGSYSATHNTASSYNFTRNSLMSSLNGNLTTKFSRPPEQYRANVMPISKATNASKPLMMSTNFSYSSSSQGSKENNPGALTGLNDIVSNSLNSVSSKNGSSRTLDQNRFSLHDNFASYDGRGPSKPTYISQEIPSSSDNNFLSGANSRNDIQNYSKNHTSHNNENIPPSSKTNNPQTPAAKKVLAPIPNHEPTKCSVKRNGIVKAYAANTNQGIVRNYNEDRVSIILNIMKPASRINEDWPKCSFFGVYDGHGGVNCADFLRDNLHQYVIKEPSFPWNPKEALLKGFDAAEKAFLEIAQSNPSGEIDRSGSCAIVVLIIGDMCYVANVGDSRAVMSGEGGAKIYPLSKDHKPNDESEQKRIIEGGGKIYQTQAPALRQVQDGNTTKPQMQLLLGPHRVFPGRLSVSRTFGDIEAKLQKLGGNPNVVIALPEIKAFKIAAEHDYIVLASDGIFDKLSSRDVVKSVWESTQEQANNIHQQCGLGVENILREAIFRRTLDNITVVMICFKNFKYKLFPRERSQKEMDENINRREIDANVIRNSSLLKSSSNAGRIPVRNNSQNAKERFNDQENNYDANYFNNVSKTPNGRKLLETNSDPHLMESKRYNIDRVEVQSSDPNALNKRAPPKRVGSAVGLSDNQKNDTIHRHVHNANSANFKSADYKNGESFKYRSYADAK